MTWKLIKNAEIMKKEIRNEQPRPFRLAHQTLCITAFNFETESLMGYVEMLIHPLRNDLRKIKLNSKQCRIYRVAVNDIWESPFSYNDPTLEICQGDGKQRNLEFFETCQYQAMCATDADNGTGEVLIKLPSEAFGLVADMKPFKLVIEFSLERPKGGVQFVVPDTDGTMLDRGAHLFTNGHENSTRLWFPCVDSYSEVCTWKLELTVDMYMIAVACGDLIETVYTADLRKKTYRYYLGIPTAAPNIGLAVGPFEVYVDPHMHEVTHFCLPHMLPLLKHSVAQLHETFEFYEEVLSSRYPYSCYKQIFVDHLYGEHRSYSTLSLFSINLLHTRRIVEQTPVSRRVMALALAEQFFGCYMGMASWYDAWLPKGMARYLSGIYCRKAFGNNEYRYHIAKELEAVAEYEVKHGGILLDPSAQVNTGQSHYFSPKKSHTVSTAYASAYALKSHLVMRMLELRTGRELLLQVFNKALTLASSAAQAKITSNTWCNLLLSASSFLKAMATVTGKDSHPFIEQWVHSCGVPKFYGSFVFNRKRNVVELELKQDYMSKGSMRYVGPLTVAIQELDGTFKHTFKIEENSTKFEITCHSKSRRQKRKKIPLCTGEEVDMDLNDMEPDSPVLWLRIDPDLELIRMVKLDQPDFMWQYMLRHERCIVAQSLAIRALGNFPTTKSRAALTDTLENEQCFYRVRIQAAVCLAKVANAMEGQWAGPPAMMSMFRNMFGAHLCPTIVRRNNFNNFQRYFMQKSIPIAMASLRNSLQICPPEVFNFILDLLKYNDNSRNKYTDNYYRAALIDALAATVTPAVTTVTLSGTLPSTDLLTPDTKLILEEITRALNMEKLLPSYRHVLTVSCLRAIRRLQKFGHLPSDPTIFKSYAVAGNFLDVRLSALKALVDFTKVEMNSDTLYWLLELVEEDPEPFVRHIILRYIVDNPPFEKNEQSPLATEALVERLWRLMNTEFSYDSRLRCDIADVYFTLYGKGRPSCVPIPESVMVLNLREKTTTLNSSLFPEAQESNSALKRRAASPLTGLDQPGSDDSQFKLKIKFGVKSSPDHSDTFSVASTSREPARTFSPASFSADFMKYSTVIPDAQSAPPADIFAGDASSPPAPPGTSSLQDMDENSGAGLLHGGGAGGGAMGLHDDTSRMSRLSDSSDSNSIRHGFTYSGDQHGGPTSFDSSMFKSDSKPEIKPLDTYRPPSPPQAMSLPTDAPLFKTNTSDLFSVAGVKVPTFQQQMSAPVHGEESKHKKKKKKNKHKKHKHNKGDRDKSSTMAAVPSDIGGYTMDHSSNTGAGYSNTGTAFSNTGAGYSNTAFSHTAAAGLSSCASNTNSPVTTRHERRSSSPDFEVI